MMRYTGAVQSYLPPTAPLELLLPAEVYALDGDQDLSWRNYPTPTSRLTLKGWVVLGVLGIGIWTIFGALRRR